MHVLAWAGIGLKPRGGVVPSEGRRMRPYEGGESPAGSGRSANPSEGFVRAMPTLFAENSDSPGQSVTPLQPLSTSVQVPWQRKWCFPGIAAMEIELF